MDELVKRLQSAKTIAILCVSFFAAGLVIGFFAGRTQAEVREVVKWKKGDVVRDTINLPYPVKEYETELVEIMIPGEVIRDTITKAVIHIDTPLIARDYLLRREYIKTFFDSEEKGRLVVSTSVQYNKQSQILIDYQPVVKEVFRNVEPIITPFVSGGINTMNFYSVGGGMFYKDVGFEYGYNRSFLTDADYHNFSIKLKF